MFAILWTTFFFLYLFGSLTFLLLEYNHQALSITDGFYFVGMTLSLTGFGDIVCTQALTKMWLIIFLPLGVGSIFTICFRFFGVVKDRLDQEYRLRTWKKIVLCFFLLFSMSVFLSLAVVALEGWTFIDSLYLTTNALGT